MHLNWSSRYFCSKSVYIARVVFSTALHRHTFCKENLFELTRPQNLERNINLDFSTISILPLYYSRSYMKNQKEKTFPMSILLGPPMASKIWKWLCWQTRTEELVRSKVITLYKNIKWSPLYLNSFYARIAKKKKLDMYLGHNLV